MSDMKQNRRNGPRAESASLSGPCACERHSDQNHFTRAERDEGWDEW